MSYQDTADKLNKLRREKSEVLFRMAISHLLDVGARHLTPENIVMTCEEIMCEDDTNSFMTNEFKCELIRTAGELAQLNLIDLLVYIQREVSYDVGDGMFLADWPDYVGNLVDKLCCGMASAHIYETLTNSGFWNGDIQRIGYGWCIPLEELP